jgi:Recombination directionality factor-like
MPIIDIQRRLTEVGRIRIGQKVPIGATGKTRPAKLESFRLTSPNKTLITAASNLYGGTVQPWDAPTGKQWEVITDTTTLPVIVPPTDLGFTQHYELWAQGGCLRRCDGQTATIPDNGNLTENDCLCDPGARECKPHTRLSVMLADLPGLGLWRLDTQGYYAATELLGATEILNTARHHGVMLPATLRLQQEIIKRPGQTTRRFNKPVLDVNVTPAELTAAAPPPRALDAGPMTIDDIRDSDTPEAITADDILNSDDPELAILAYGRARARAQENTHRPGNLTPVPTAPDDPPPIADQIRPPEARPRRGQLPIPPTGLAPRTAGQAATQSDVPAASLKKRRGRPPKPRPEPEIIATAESVTEGDTAGALADLTEPAAEPYWRNTTAQDTRCDGHDPDNNPCTLPHGHPLPCQYTTGERGAWEIIGGAERWESVEPDPNQGTLWPHDLADMPPPGNPEPAKLITPEQLTKLSIQLREQGFTGNTDDDRQARHDFVAAIIGHQIDTAKHLTMSEASDVISILEHDQTDKQ